MRRFANEMTWAEDRGGFAIDAAVSERMGFIRRTYLHLGGEVLLVGAVAAFILNTPALLEGIAIPLISNLLIYILAFFGVSFISRKLMEGQKSIAVQYLGAGLWVLFLGVLVAPIAWVIHTHTGSYAIVGQAFFMTATIFGALTAYVFLTKKDFSFIGGALALLTACVFGFGIVATLFGGFGGGAWWSLLWVVLLGGWILYDTSRILHHRHVSQHVAASVDLLVDFVFMFIHLALLLLGRD